MMDVLAMTGQLDDTAFHGLSEAQQRRWLGHAYNVRARAYEKTRPAAPPKAQTPQQIADQVAAAMAGR
jgi:hypothetical protein